MLIGELTLFGSADRHPTPLAVLSREILMKTASSSTISSVIRKVVRRILEDLDFEVTEAEDGRRRSTSAVSSMPDLILLDWNMPVVGGRRVPRGAARPVRAASKPKVVFCASENDVSHIARAMRAGADDYILKPFDREIVEAKLQEVGIL